jgi:hypothetical protein
MASRKQRALKLARRRDAQARHRGIRIEDGGRSKVQVPTGPRPAKGFHRSDPYEHGEELRRREQIVSFCARIGFDPSDIQIQLMREMMGQGRLTHDVVRNMASRDANERISRTIVRNFPPGTFDVDATAESIYGMESKGKTTSSLETIARVQEDGRTLYMDPEHADEVELMTEGDWDDRAHPGTMTHEELEQDAWDQAAYEQRMGWPTPAQWAELEAAAKAKKKGARGYVRVLEEAGFVLGKNEDPRDRTSWTRS